MEIKLVPSNEIENILCEAVKPEEVEHILNIIIPQMAGILRATNTGIGLAAPQVGIKKKFFIVKNSQDNFDVYFNAFYVKDSECRIKSTEGCLSYGLDNMAQIKRFKSVKIIHDEWIDGQLVRKDKKLKQRNAIVFQHEIDHCGNGIERTSRTIFSQ